MTKTQLFNKKTGFQFKKCEETLKIIMKTKVYRIFKLLYHSTILFSPVTILDLSFLITDLLYILTYTFLLSPQCYVIERLILFICNLFKCLIVALFPRIFSSCYKIKQ